MQLGDPHPFVRGAEQYVVYRGAGHHVRLSSRAIGGGWSEVDLTSAGVSGAESDPRAYVDRDRTIRVVYRDLEVLEGFRATEGTDGTPSYESPSGLAEETLLIGLLLTTRCYRATDRLE